MGYSHTTEIKAYLHKHDVFSWSQALPAQATSPLSAEHAGWEYLDSMCTAGMLFAESKYRQLRMGKTNCSPIDTP
jgi:hypothetical protein